MPNADFFASLGVVVIEGFLSPAACARLAEEIDFAPARPAALGRQTLDRAERRALSVEPPRRTRALVERRLLALKPRLQEAYGKRLSALQLDFLRYRRGDFYRPHVDGLERDGKTRRVSAVLFLNEGYRGGRLLFHRLLGTRAPWSRCALPAPAAAGTLVAFPSSIMHSVEPVASGRRASVAGWFS